MRPALHQDTLRVAETLLKGGGEDPFRWRRAVSSAYYALFQGLCAAVAKNLSRAQPGAEEYRRAYRLLNHSDCRKQLNQSQEFKTDLGVPFAELQDVRQWADYSIAPHPDDRIAKTGEAFSYGEAHLYLRKAEVSLAHLSGLALDEQIRLTVTLVVAKR